MVFRKDATSIKDEARRFADAFLRIHPFPTTNASAQYFPETRDEFEHYAIDYEAGERPKARILDFAYFPPHSDTPPHTDIFYAAMFPIDQTYEAFQDLPFIKNLIRRAKVAGIDASVAAHHPHSDHYRVWMRFTASAIPEDKVRAIAGIDAEVCEYYTNCHNP